jgi:hypothetical protein
MSPVIARLPMAWTDPAYKRTRPAGQATDVLDVAEPTIRKGQPIVRATITVGDDVTHIRLDASRTVTPPSLRWRLTRL